MGQFIDLTGKKFNLLTVMYRGPDYISPSGMHMVRWYCKCDCGNPELTLVSGCSLKSKTSPIKSCGCLMKYRSKPTHTTHGGSYERLYGVWCSMKSRCYYQGDKNYKNYGGRGIIVCDEWRNSYNNFKSWALSNGYQADAPRGKCMIERIDVNGNYCPENCVWKTNKEQANNKTNNHLVEHQGETHTISEWAGILNMAYNTLLNRINHGWTIERALTEPVHNNGGNRRKNPNFKEEM